MILTQANLDHALTLTVALTVIRTLTVALTLAGGGEVRREAGGEYYNRSSRPSRLNVDFQPKTEVYGLLVRSRARRTFPDVSG